MPVGMSYLSTCTFYSKSFWCQLKSSLYSFSLFVPNFKYTSCAYICIMYHVYLYYANTWRSTCQPIYFLSHFILHCILYLVFCIYFVCFVFLCSLGCPKKKLFLNFVSAVEPLVQTSSQSPRKKFQRYRPINDTLTTIWNFGLI